MSGKNPHFLGQIAIHEGYITPEQLDECLGIQRASDPPRKLGAIFVHKGYLTQEQLAALMDIQRLKLETIASDPERGGLFGQIALRLGFATQLQLDECLREQHSLSHEGSPVLLGQILLRKNYLTPDQFLQILRKQKRETVKCSGCDTIYDAHSHPQGAKFVCSRCGTVVQIPLRPTDHPTHPGDSTRRFFRDSADAKGDVIGRYVILEQIGQGGMGVVYKALHRDLNRTFALKVLKAGDDTTFDTVRRFQREARLAAKLKHPHIVSVHDAGEDAGLHYIAMEFIEGEAFSARLISGRSKMRDDLVLLEKVARAVAYAHSQGVIHRDLKPANVMVDPHDQPHIMDFGLAKQAADAALLTREGSFLGTPFYMAPEQLSGDTSHVDAQTDVYSLGIILYEILTHRVPHSGDNSAEIFNKIINVDPPSVRDINPKIHPDVQTICMKAIEKDRRLRYPSAEGLAEDLRRYLEGEPIVARPLGPVGRIARRVRKNPALAVASVATVLLAVTGLSLLVTTLRSASARREHVAEARAARERGDLDRAEASLEQALALRPGDPEAAPLLEEVRDAIRLRRERAAAHRLAEVQRAKATPRIDEAREAVQRLAVRLVAERLPADEIARSCAATERVLDEALALSPGDERALFWMARSRLLRGDTDGALRHLDEACRSREFPEAAFERGRLLLRRVRPPRALPRLKALEDLPLFTDASGGSSAGEVARRLARIDLDSVRQHSEVRWMFRFAEAALDFLDLKLESAETKLSACLAADPGDPDALALRALARLSLSRPRDALADLDLALRYRPVDGFLQDWRAIARFLVGDAAGALEDLSRDGAEFLRGTIRYARGEYAEAHAAFEKAVAASPRSADALAGRAAAQAALDHLPEADSDFGRAIALAPDEADHFENRGLLRLRMGRRAEAARDLERAIEISPNRRAWLQSHLNACRPP